MDDEYAVRSIITEMLEQYGYSVVAAADGAEAVERFREAHEREQSFDAVIMDLTVPGGLGGKEALGQLLQIDPQVKAIVVSGYSNDPVMANYGNYGFAACLGKPFSPDTLARTLDEVMAKTTLDT